MVNYKELGLVNTRDMFSRAVKSGWAVPAFNFNNLEQLQAIITASSELRSPVILQVSKGARKYANATLLRYMAEGAVQFAKELGCNHPEIVLHLDHGDSFELCKSCVDLGFSSVMIDGSSLPYEENIALTEHFCEGVFFIFFPGGKRDLFRNQMFQTNDRISIFAAFTGFFVLASYITK